MDDEADLQEIPGFNWYNSGPQKNLNHMLNFGLQQLRTYLNLAKFNKAIQFNVM